MEKQATLPCPSLRPLRALLRHLGRLRRARRVAGRQKGKIVARTGCLRLSRPRRRGLLLFFEFLAVPNEQRFANPLVECARYDDDVEPSLLPLLGWKRNPRPFAVVAVHHPNPVDDDLSARAIGHNVQGDVGDGADSVPGRQRPSRLVTVITAHLPFVALACLRLPRKR